MAKVSNLNDAFNWNITKLADAFGLNRATVRKRLKEAGVIPVSSRKGTSLYALSDAGPALFGETIQRGINDPDEMCPKDRKDWFQSENERIKLQRDSRQLIPVEETHSEMSLLVKAVANTLESLSDMLERDAGLPPEAIERVEQVTDDLREQMFQAIVDVDDDTDID